MRIDIVNFVLSVCVLANCAGCAGEHSQIQSNLIKAGTGSSKDQIDSELMILLQDNDCKAVLNVFLNAQDRYIFDKVTRIMKDRSQFPDSDLLLRNTDRMIVRRGHFMTADILICRGEAEGLAMLYTVFVNSEAKDVPEVDRAREQYGLEWYLFQMTHIEFKSAIEYKSWLAINEKKITFDMADEPYFTRPPSVVIH